MSDCVKNEKPIIKHNEEPSLKHHAERSINSSVFVLQQVKAIERFMRHLEFHLSKV